MPGLTRHPAVLFDWILACAGMTTGCNEDADYNRTRQRSRLHEPQVKKCLWLLQDADVNRYQSFHKVEIGTAQIRSPIGSVSLPSYSTMPLTNFLPANVARFFSPTKSPTLTLAA